MRRSKHTQPNYQSDINLCSCQHKPIQEPMGIHSWKCYINRDVHIQYHRLKINEQLNKKDKKRAQSHSNHAIKMASSSNMKQSLYKKKILQDNTKRSMERGLQNFSRQYKRSLFDQTKYLRRFQIVDYDNHLDNLQRQQLNKNYRYDHEYGFNQDNWRSRSRADQQILSKKSGTRSMKGIGLSPEEYSFSDRNEQNLKLVQHNTTCYDSQSQTSQSIGPNSLKESKIQSLAQRITLKKKLRENNIQNNKNKVSEAQSTILKIKREDGNQLRFPIKISEKANQETQTRDVIILEPHVHSMQQEERQYLRDQFINHYGLVHRKKF